MTGEPRRVRDVRDPERTEFEDPTCRLDPEEPLPTVRFDHVAGVVPGDDLSALEVAGQGLRTRGRAVVGVTPSTSEPPEQPATEQAAHDEGDRRPTNRPRVSTGPKIPIPC